MIVTEMYSKNMNCRHNNILVPYCQHRCGGLQSGRGNGRGIDFLLVEEQRPTVAGASTALSAIDSRP